MTKLSVCYPCAAQSIFGVCIDTTRGCDIRQAVEELRQSYGDNLSVDFDNPCCGWCRCECCGTAMDGERYNLEAIA